MIRVCKTTSVCRGQEASLYTCELMSSRRSRRIASRRSPTTARSTRKQLSLAWTQSWQRWSRTVCHTQDTRSLLTNAEKQLVIVLKITDNTNDVTRVIPTGSQEQCAAASPGRRQHPLHHRSLHLGWLISEPWQENPGHLVCLCWTMRWMGNTKLTLRLLKYVLNNNNLHELL